MYYGFFLFYEGVLRLNEDVDVKGLEYFFRMLEKSFKLYIFGYIYCKMGFCNINRVVFGVNLGFK